MTTLWDREFAAERLRSRLWRYLSATANVKAGGSVDPAGLHLHRSDLVRIFATHLALAESTGAALGAARDLLDQMPSSAAAQRVELLGEVRGQVNWARTHERRILAGDPTLFVCSPPERRYDTPLGRLIHLSLRCIAQLADLSSLTADGPVGSLVHETSDQARRILLHPKLSKVRRIDHGSLRHTADLIARRPLARDLANVVHKFVGGVVECGVDELRALLEGQFLAPHADSQLFELQVGFDLIAALEDCGFEIEPPLALLPGSKAPFAVMRGPGGQGTIFWQRPVWVVRPTQRRSGAWWTALHDNGLSQQPLRPDFVVDLPGIGRRFIVEVKLTSQAEGSPDRDGIRDAMAYLLDGRELFEGYVRPHAMVVAWNSPASPTASVGMIRVSNQNTWVSSLRLLVEGALRGRSDLTT